MPNITSATDTHASAKPAVSVTMGARKVNAAKVPPLISAPSAMARMSRGVANGLSDKMCVCYRRVAGLDVAFLDAD